ncbi:hypothetical protein H0H81_010975 [Sphagnurus paluster]|uniref:Uncharacterized protein n=1 Tax=Sphagnurus paluster TaxID=117069 RepID=A0A9P7GLP9_9AGAR|nr:hypothetical protein H0H81_010975 [Sphagnurus paluster]
MRKQLTRVKGIERKRHVPHSQNFNTLLLPPIQHKIKTKFQNVLRQIIITIIRMQRKVHRTERRVSVPVGSTHHQSDNERAMGETHSNWYHGLTSNNTLNGLPAKMTSSKFPLRPVTRSWAADGGTNELSHFIQTEPAIAIPVPLNPPMEGHSFMPPPIQENRVTMDLAEQNPGNPISTFTSIPSSTSVPINLYSNRPSSNFVPSSLKAILIRTTENQTVFASGEERGPRETETEIEYRSGYRSSAPSPPSFCQNSDREMQFIDPVFPNVAHSNTSKPSISPYIPREALEENVVSVPSGPLGSDITCPDGTQNLISMDAGEDPMSTYKRPRNACVSCAQLKIACRTEAGIRNHSCT